MTPRAWLPSGLKAPDLPRRVRHLSAQGHKTFVSIPPTPGQVNMKIEISIDRRSIDAVLERQDREASSAVLDTLLGGRPVSPPPCNSPATHPASRALFPDLARYSDPPRPLFSRLPPGNPRESIQPNSPLFPFPVFHQPFR